MPLLNDLLDMGKSEIPFDRTVWPSKVSLERIGTKWSLIEYSAETVVSLTGITRSGESATPRPFIDNVEYTFGISLSEDKNKTIVVEHTDRAAKVHSAYVKSIKDSGIADSDPIVASFITFIDNDPYEALISGKHESAIQKINELLFKGANSILVCGPNGAFAEIYANMIGKYNSMNARCSLSGKIETHTDIKHMTLRGVFNATQSLVTLSCNTKAFPVLANYNFDSLNGSPISSESYVTITRNLQRLISDPKTCITVPKSNGISYLIRYDNVSIPEQGTISAILNTPTKVDDLHALGYDDEDFTDETCGCCLYTASKPSCEDLVYKKYRTIRNGTIMNTSASGTVTVYRIHSVKGRWSCTDEFTVDIGTLFKNIDTWYKDTVTDGRPHSIYWLLRSSLPENGRMDPKDYEFIMKAILRGAEIPRTILKRVLHRVETAHNGVSPCQFGLIRACYNSNARNTQKKELTDMLDTDNKSYAYNLGRLLAIGDYMQKKANPNISTPLSDRLFKRAVIRPTECMKEALRRIRVYHNQMIPVDAKKGAAIYGMKLVDSVSTTLYVERTEPLSSYEQAELHIGWSHQTANFYQKQSKNGDA